MRKSYSLYGIESILLTIFGFIMNINSIQPSLKVATQGQCVFEMLEETSAYKTVFRLGYL